VLLAHAMGCPRSYLYSHGDEPLEIPALQRFQELLAARASGEPVAYITGEREFWSLPLKVTAATLIPRPETELLVEQALLRIPSDADWEILDLGTGSGAIALALAKERPLSRIVATDVSAAALRVAAENAMLLGIGNLEFQQGHWFAPLDNRQFQMIVSNPPYVRDQDPHLQQGDLRFEPRVALASGRDGLEAIRHIVQQAPRHLSADAPLLLEHGYDQGDAVRALLQAWGYTDIASARDMRGIPRVSSGIWAASSVSR